MAVRRSLRKSKPARKTKRAASRHAKRQLVPELEIITGMSGTGKASVLKAFKDLGYYCVDNLPVELIPNFAELAMQSGEKTAARRWSNRRK